MADETPEISKLVSRREELKKRLGIDGDRLPGPGISSIDGMQRTLEAEREMNEICHLATRGGNGKRFAEYLASITINQMGGPGIEPDRLMHLEGQRFLYGVIMKRAELGKRQK